MGYMGFGDLGTVGQFVYCYVQKAFELAKNQPSLEDFDNNLSDFVAKSSGLSKKVIIELHHPFHWYLFNQNGDSPLEFINPVKKDEVLRVKIKKESYGYIDVLEASGNIVDKYGNLLIAKRKTLQQEPSIY
jgi:hypothetical protein